MKNKNLNINESVSAKSVPEKSEVALREEEILTFWKENDIFNKSVDKEAPNGDYVFYDGPPFATGTPHYGHILASTIKDAIPRFWTMNGYRVERKWGWDCHGLPLENLIEKKLGLGTKRDIEEYGVKNFNEAAREAVLEYRDEWKWMIPRLGRWADMDNDYRTMDSTYTESVWWVFNELNKKGLVYEGFKSMHLCPRCGTTLSNFEVNQGYKDIKDIAVTVKLPLLDENGEKTDTSLLVWTTTPWTLPGNFAAAVNKEVDYVKVKLADETVILAKERLMQLGEEDFEIIAEFKGSELVGKSYVPPFDFWQKREVEGKENAWKIYHADYVEIGTEGTGAVHLAPAYGEDDMNLAKAHNIPIAHHVDESGHFMDFIEGFSCALVKPKDDDQADVSHLDSDIEVVKALKEKGVLFKKENITHSYPHCWRCDTPLLNYATTSWFVRVTDIKNKLVAENSAVHWVPENVGTNRFGRWLEGARDWAVSRQRYWGAPLPIWRNPETKEYKVFGSLEELTSHAKKSGNQYVVMRHCEADFNLTGEINADPSRTNSLTENGKKQAREAAEEFRKMAIDTIVHSVFPRSRETAEVIAETLGLPKEALMEDDRLNELNVGSEWEGKNWIDYDSHLASPMDWLDKRNSADSETHREVIKRSGNLLYEIDSKYSDKKILFVGHGSSVYGLRMAAVGVGESTVGKLLSSLRRLGHGEREELFFTPLPHNDNYELDFHRPYIDDYEVYDEEGTRLERVKDVFDCWFESGSMPYGQHHYPFEHKDEFEKNLFPANFIAESVDQTRGWFYSMMVLGVALFDKSPYQNVITNGLVLAEDGKKMSKSQRNYPDPMELVDRVGSDAIRFYLLSTPIMRGEDLNFSEKEVTELMRKNIGRLHNVLAMYEMFADGTEAKADSQNVLDQWILSRLSELVTETTEGFKNYELDKATRPIADFVDDLSVWYLRRSRDRFKSDDNQDKTLALATLRHVLQTLSLVMAPAMPFYSEYLWSRVKHDFDQESVHLSQWPEVGMISDAILTDMKLAREIVTQALEARTQANIKVRQPVASVTGPLIDDTIQKVILDEVNAKNYKIGDTVEIDTNITPELKLEGDARDFIRAVQDLRKQKGLEPSDRISLLVQTSDSGEAVVQQFEAEIKKVVGADSITFGDASGDEVLAGGHSYTVEINTD